MQTNVHPALYCGIFSTGYMRDTEWLLRNFKNKLNLDVFQVDWKTCRRVGCKNTSAVYICNDTKSLVQATGERIYNLGWIPQQNCCHQGPSSGITGKVGKGISGQKFTGAGWNVIIGYGNCNHGETADRPSMGPEDNPWGPNLKCYTEFYGLSPSPTNGDVQTKRDGMGTEEVYKGETEYELVDDGTGVMDLVERENAEEYRMRAVERRKKMDEGNREA